MKNPFTIGAISWFLPGVGHIVQGRLVRGLIIGGVIWTMFIIAAYSGGLYYPGFSFKDGSLLYLLNIFAKLGNGLGGLISFIGASDPPKGVAAWATFEYGGRFIEVAGLLNYLAVMDAADINSGRKE
ncbi:MAG: hypothetical protein IPN69_12180 [Acidobacteria bacterium]|nr:hypothetical protein [Acidobacteriota bacterium]MBK8150653.1 hypothetical protein [Acidobacteriota bacterium]MBK8811474.1 hypothetical protein [Acidobacteriota bacterium]